MKDKTITVRVPDFCPEDCPEFKPNVRRLDVRTIDGVVDVITSYACENEGYCRNLHAAIQKGRREPIVESYEVKDALPGDCFHSEVWHRCPYCGEAWEAMGATYYHSPDHGKMYECKRCGRKMRVR